ncbi:MAG: hypothetical protein ABI744_07435 [Chloroflexota bacterium]
MPENNATLIVAALAVFIALMVWLVRAVTGRLGELGAGLRAVDVRLANGAPVLAARIGAARADLTTVSTQTELALWSLSRLDERLDATREELVQRHAALDKDRERLIAARTTIIRVRKSAGLILKMLELRRAFLG